jgi:histidine ammonia-lyase
LLGAGFAKERLQNPDVKELTGHNLEDKGVRSAAMIATCTASALTILS